jgi:hypothetical protein
MLPKFLPAARGRLGRAPLSMTVLAAAALLAACAVHVDNTRPAAELARASKPPGSVYAGWRIFNDRCARCHGVDAAAPAQVPGLLDEMRDMGSRRFVNLVLVRYDWSRPDVQGASEEAARTDLVEDILQRRETPIEMPAWQGEPRVEAHILDLYAYLTARADGAQGPGRPLAVD